ncbi:MAG TPA: hypothetical protein VGH24_03270 [Solirubrobacteraceae bacterium]
MRGSRVAIVVGVIGLVLLGAGWSLAAAGSPRRSQHPTARMIGARVPAPLLRYLQQYLNGAWARPRPRVQSRVLPAPRKPAKLHGTRCLVAAGGFCSTTPCVVPAATGAASGCPAGAAPPQTRRVTSTSSATFRLTTP